MSTAPCPVSCRCHTGPYATCDTPGGCGTTGCGTTTCVLCPTLRPSMAARQPERSPACDGCRRRLDLVFSDLFGLHDRLVNPEPAEYDRRRYQRRDQQGKRTGEYRDADPLAAVGGVGNIPGRTNQPHVSGSRTNTTPIDVDTVDLTGSARVPNPTDRARQWPGDQIGHLSVATRLYEVVRDWRDTLWPDQHLPVATVPELVGWIRAGSTPEQPGPRVDEACDRHPAIATTAAEMWDLRGWLRTALGDTDPPPRRWLGVTCGRCTHLSRIAQIDGDEYAECGGCGTLYSETELAALIGGQAAQERAGRTPQEVSALLRA